MRRLSLYQRVLVLAPHTDDGELGCGGTLTRLLDAGAEIFYCAFSICEESVPQRFPDDVLDSEVREATRRLGIPPENLTVLGFRVRHFPSDRQEILENIVDLRRQTDPDLVFLPCQFDLHQDHRVIHDEGIRAFKRTTVLGYELPWNNLEGRAQVLVRLDQEHLDRKFEALKAYESQQHRNYVTEEFLRDLARVRGVQAGYEYAEAFQLVRWMVP